MTGVLTKQGSLNTDMHAGRKPWWRRGSRRGIHKSRNTKDLQKAGGQSWNRLFVKPSERTHPARSLTWTSNLQSSEAMELFRWYLVWKPGHTGSGLASPELCPLALQMATSLLCVTCPFSAHTHPCCLSLS